MTLGLLALVALTSLDSVPRYSRGAQPLAAEGRDQRQSYPVRRKLLSQRPAPLQPDHRGQPSDLGQRAARNRRGAGQGLARCGRAIREDLERGAPADVTEAWEAYPTASASAVLAEEGLAVAGENFRVQERRYQAGASTILDLLEAQNRLAEAEVELVQARCAARLALAGLEVLLGRRLTP